MVFGGTLRHKLEDNQIIDGNPDAEGTLHCFAFFIQHTANPEGIFAVEFLKFQAFLLFNTDFSFGHFCSPYFSANPPGPRIKM